MAESKNSLVKWIAFGIGLAVLVVFFLANYAGAHNTANTAEQGIKGAYTENQNVLSQFGLKVQEAAQVPTIATEDLEKILTAGNESRYGENGSQASFQVLREAYPGQIDPSLYRNLQDIIAGGRTDFAASQKKLIDRKVAYETQLGSFWTGAWMKAAGFPKIKLDEYKVVTSARSDKAFTTGQDEAIKLR